MDSVIQFAIHELGFQPEEILLFGWSIGGYSSLVAAAQYPDIKGVVNNRTFCHRRHTIDRTLMLLFTFKGSRCNV